MKKIATGNYDVVIAGGGIMGSSIAYWLASNPDFNGSIAVIEKDSTYAYSSTALSNSSIRMQFSTPLNINISKFGINFIKNINDYLSVDDEKIDLGFVEAGYLFLSTSAKGREILLENLEVQKQQGITDIISMEPSEIRERFPWLNVDGIDTQSSNGNSDEMDLYELKKQYPGIDVKSVTCGTFGLRNEGWFDPWTLLQAFKRKAISLGVTYINDEIINLVVSAKKIEKVELKVGQSITPGVVVNAAGTWSQHIARMVGLEIPVTPKQRFVFVFSCPTRIPNCPLVIDSEGFYFRPDGELYLCGMKPPASNDPDGHNFNVDYSWFDKELWPRLARWVPAFGSVKLERAWAGHYAYNSFDHNALLGPHPMIENLHFVNGFSGHGMQQSPAIGRGMSELITYGEFRSLDMNEFLITRILENRPVFEKYVV